MRGLALLLGFKLAIDLTKVNELPSGSGRHPQCSETGEESTVKRLMSAELLNGMTSIRVQ